MFDEILVDMVSLLKATGQRFDNIKAGVQSKSILIVDAALPLEEGDTILRVLPNGLEERYLVLDRGYHVGMMDVPAHYSARVQKESSRALSQPHSVIYNLHGANSRVNIQTHDHSVNVVQTTAPTLFEELRKALAQGIQNQEDRKTLIARVDDLEAQQDTPSFLDAYKDFILQVGAYMSIVAPFIPALTQLLQR